MFAVSDALIQRYFLLGTNTGYRSYSFPSLDEVHNLSHTCLLVSTLLLGLFYQGTLLWTKTVCSARNRPATWWEEWFLCGGKENNGPLVLTKLFHRQLPQLSCAVTHAEEVDTHPPSSILPFLLVQNLFSKLIVPTDNMRPSWMKTVVVIKLLNCYSVTVCQASIPPGVSCV